MYDFPNLNWGLKYASDCASKCSNGAPLRPPGAALKYCILPSATQNPRLKMTPPQIELIQQGLNQKRTDLLQ